MAGPALLSFGLVDGRPVFMDDWDDSYFRIDPSVEREFLDRSAGIDAVPANCDPGMSLLLGINCEHCQIVRADGDRPTSSLLDDWAGEPTRSWRDFGRITILLHRTRIHLARRPIAEILNKVASDLQGPSRASSRGDVLALAVRFSAVRRLIPIRRNCLLDSLAMIRWLGPSEQLALVFGVKLDPFAAHCWVQLEDCAINDRLDHIAPFSPVRHLKCMPVSR